MKLRKTRPNAAIFRAEIHAYFEPYDDDAMSIEMENAIEIVKVHGTPIINIVQHRDYAIFRVLNGFRELQAAMSLGIKPCLRLCDPSEMIDIKNCEWYDSDLAGGDDLHPARLVAAWLYEDGIHCHSLVPDLYPLEKKVYRGRIFGPYEQA
jgi:hypothetical protein